ncbi:hypothetical protein C0J52_26515 [Blattella germanica]|nr:hypothetical protein C0J52_26515 [Blattella germanica]
MASFQGHGWELHEPCQIPSSHTYSNEPWICVRCGRKYKWKSSLRSHQANECGKEPQYQCHYCPLRCKIKSNLRRHLRKFHYGLPVHVDDS